MHYLSFLIFIFKYLTLQCIVCPKSSTCPWHSHTVIFYPMISIEILFYTEIIFLWLKSKTPTDALEYCYNSRYQKPEWGTDSVVTFVTIRALSDFSFPNLFCFLGIISLFHDSSYGNDTVIIVNWCIFSMGLEVHIFVKIWYPKS